MGHQRIVASKDIFSSSTLTIQEQRIQLPNGKEVTKETISLGSVVFIFPLTSSYEIYLSNEFRVLLEKEVLGAIGGRVDTGESALDAAKRELEEEGGITAGQWELFATVENSRSVIRNKGYMYLAKELEVRKSRVEEDEEIEIVKMPLSEAVEKVMTGEIYHSPSIAGILMLNELRRKKLL